jgi:uncharacterized protein YndB with AHSA1/START domain
MRVLAVVALISAGPLAAEVKSVSDHGFEVAGTAVVKAPPAEVYQALGKVGNWWSSAHTYSGDARNMTIVVEPGGCFCEAVPAQDFRIEHGRVVYAQPGKMLRLSAALGPLQAEGASGALTWALKPLPDGQTEISMSYVVGGYVRGGIRPLAPIVDMVMIEQLGRLKAHLDSGQPR